MDVGDRVVGQVLGEVVAVLGGPGLLGQVVVRDQGRAELVGLPVEEAVEALEAPPQRPAGPGRPVVPLVLGRQVPLADGPGGVAVGHQRGGQHPAGGRDAGVVAREAGGQLHDAAHAHRVVVAAGEQAGPGRRAQGGGVEVGVAEPAGGEAVEGRGVDVRAEAARAGRSPRRRARRAARSARPAAARVGSGPPRRRLVVVPPDRPPELPRFHDGILSCGPMTAADAEPPSWRAACPTEPIEDLVETRRYLH